MRFLSHIAALGLTALLAANATEAQDRAPDTIRLKDRSTLKGYATAYDATTRVLSFHTADGRDMQINLGDLDAPSVYRVTQSTIPKDNARAQLDLANYARDAGLYAHALRHYGYAEKADPAMNATIEKDRAVLREKAADFALENARTAIKHDNLREAKKWLTKIVEWLPDEPQADEAAKMLDGLYMRDPLHLDLPVAYNAPSILEVALAPGKAHYDSMLQKTQDGLTNRRGGNFSTTTWQSALIDGEQGLREIEQLEKTYTDAPSREVLTGYRKLFIAQIVELRLHLASVWTTRSSYNRAMGEVNQALALDPRNRDALAARARVAQASNSGVGWWY
jgi:tetratricopeptide (TPR) repeat protein